MEQPSKSKSHRLPEDQTTPGGVYLCQVGQNVSCGACCGLYNVQDTSRDAMVGMLADRTRRFVNVPRTMNAIEEFARDTKSMESPERPFPHFHHCPYIGLIGPALSRAGCLLHPLAEGNEGVDFRGLSHYGGFACRTYFCPATNRPEARHKRLVRAILNDWHLYGLVITEIDLISSFFKQIEQISGQRLDDALASRNPAVVAPLVDLLRLKINWPYRPKGSDTPCHYFFFDIQYEKPAVDYKRLKAAPSIYDSIFKELVSQFDHSEDLNRAEQMVQERIDAVMRVL